MREAIAANKTLEDKEPLLELIDRIQLGQVFLHEEQRRSLELQARNLHLSKCYNCKKFAVWVYQSLVFPPPREGIAPNADLPEDIRRDFDEARAIASQSPRGAAALLRLCIQKLCAFLGEKGDRIDDDIAELVKRGLSPIVQQSLDAVRVIGNQAVHPGSMDLKDDHSTANTLFRLVNIVADQMVTHPKQVKEVYDKLPERALKAIEKRDGKDVK